MALRVAYVVAGEPELGLWCDRCLTSGRVSWPTYLLTDHGVRRWGRVEKCTTCDRQDEGNHGTH